MNETVSEKSWQIFVIVEHLLIVISYLKKVVEEEEVVDKKT